MEWRYLLLLIALMTVQSGCRSLNSDKAASPIEKLVSPLQGERDKQNALTQESESSTAEAVKMVLIWKENFLKTDQGRPKQGFSGRAYFHDANGAIVKVAGELNVYGYDDTVNNRGQVPDKQFVFEAGSFESHYSPNELGHSYTFWLPWCDYGGTRKMITLVPVFKSANNRILEGSADYLTLSGTAPPESGLERTIASPPSQTMSNERYAHAAQQRAIEKSIAVPQTISDNWNHHQSANSYSGIGTFPKPNPVTMQLMDLAERQAEGYRPNQVRVTQQTHNVPAPQIQDRNVSIPLHGGLPNPASNTQAVQPVSHSRLPNSGLPGKSWNYNQPAVFNQPDVTNRPAGGAAIHASLSDLAPVSATSTTPPRNRVFGQPGDLR